MSDCERKKTFASIDVFITSVSYGCMASLNQTSDFGPYK